MEKSNNGTFIFLTGSLKWDLLKFPATSISDNLSKFSDYDVWWIVCLDQYNGHGDYQKALSKVDSHIHTLVRNVGLPNQANYGGDLFNEPLREISSYCDPDNTWVYVLDDDNMVHPNLADAFKCARKYCPSANHIWLPYMIETGVIPNVRRDNALTCNHDNTLFNNAPDPSCVINRLSTLLANGLYKGEGSYDLKFIMDYIINHMDTVAFPDDYGYYHEFPIAAYHNAVEGLLRLDEIRKNCNDPNVTAEIRIQIPGCKSQIIPIPNRNESLDILLTCIKMLYISKGLLST